MLGCQANFGEHAVLTESRGTGASTIEADVEQVYCDTRAAVCSYLLWLGVPAAQAQEVTQELYLRLYQTMRKGKQILNLRAWLFRVAHNLGLKVRSREKAFRTMSPDWKRFTDITVESPERRMLDREKISLVSNLNVKALGP